MALSAAFLKKAKAIGDELKSEEARKQAQMEENKRLTEEDKAFLKQKAAPLFEALEELAALPPDKDGYTFSYTVNYKESIKSAELQVYGGYKNARGPREYAFYRVGGGEYEHLTSTFDINAIRPDVPWNKGAAYTAQAGDTDNKDGGHIAEKFVDAQQLVDGFLANWVGRNIPDAAERLQAPKPKAEKPAAPTPRRQVTDVRRAYAPKG